MKREERIKLYQSAIESWSLDKQILMVMEESGEMLNALAKHSRGRSTNEEIITELADVWILMEQMAVAFGWDEFQEEKERKLQRLKERLSAKYKL